jgi:hypothetical protein
MVIPVARKVWQPILVVSSACLTHRRIISKAFRRSSGRSDSRPVFPERRPEQLAFFVVGDPGRLEVGLEAVVDGHLVVLAALLVQPQPPALALREIVLDPHGERRADPGKAVVGFARPERLPCQRNPR